MSDDVRPRWEDFLQRAEAAYHCDHTDTKVAYKITSAQVCTYHRQCVTCGKWLGQIPKSTVPNRELTQVELYDDGLWREHSNKVYTKARTEYDEALFQYQGRFTSLYAKGLAVRTQAYDRYMKSEAWQEKRRKVLLRAKGVCEGCGEYEADDIHHLTYDRLGHEMLFDLVALCRHCHDVMHGKR